MKTLILLFALLTTASAEAVSRVGGGKVRSQSSGFEMDLPRPYDEIEDRADIVIAKGPAAYISSQGLIRLFIRVSEFGNEFPDATKLTYSELAQRLAKAGWVEGSIHQPCARVFQEKGTNLTSYIVTWGDGRGFVLNGPAFDNVDQAMHRMMQTLKIDPGSCSWK